jgi:hypothetical protein
MKLTQILPILVLPLLLLTSPAHASGDCYGEQEMNGEQMVRLHSELMVITLTCRYSSLGVPLSPAYQVFTRKHLQTIKYAEKSLMDHFRSGGARSPEGRVDKIRTKMGNAYSQKVADMSHDAFCDSYRDRVITASQWSPARVQQELRTMADEFSGQEKMCKGVRTAAVANVADESSEKKIKADDMQPARQEVVEADTNTTSVSNRNHVGGKNRDKGCKPWNISCSN